MITSPVRVQPAAEDDPDGAWFYRDGVRVYETRAALKLMGCTFRQLDYWASRGWVHPLERDRHTSGFYRYWPEREVTVIRRMTGYVNAGITPEAAHHAARNDGWLPNGAFVVVHVSPEPS